MHYREAAYRPLDFGRDTGQIALAAERLIKKCMRDAGFRYDGLASLYDRTLGFVEPDMPYRRARGYGIAYRSRPIYQPTGSEVEKYAFALVGNDAVDRVDVRTLLGSYSVPEEGCQAKAHTAIAGSPARYFWAVSVPDLYWSIIGRATDNDRRWVEVASRWSACMKRYGYEYPGPGNAVLSVTQRMIGAGDETQRLAQFEKDVARTDGECQIEVGMPAVQRAIRRDVLREASDEFVRDLRRIAAARTAALSNARRVLEDR